MEIFREISGYEGLYAVSNYGNVKSLKFGKEKILKPRADGDGYLYVTFCKNGKMKHHKVHRLVASAFIENPDNLPQVNHKDENPSNNNADNLEWCTQEYNHNYGTRNQRVAEALSIPVDILTKDGEFIRQFPSCMEAERWLRINGFPNANHSHINQCCKGKRSTAYGFKWRYAQVN
jgi:hypothetical protein